MSSFTNSRVKKSNTSSQNQSTTLFDKITECWLRQNHTQYQQLLIETKQLELSLLEQESRNKILLRNFDKKKKEIDEIENRLKDLNLENTKKKNYLISYYQHLNDKLKSNSSSVNLFSKLQSLTHSLQVKLEGERASLDEYVIKLKNDISRYDQQLNSLENRRETMKSNLHALIESKQILKQEESRKKLEQKKQKLKQRQEYEHIVAQIQKLLIEKQHLESSQNVLKKLLNIEEVHKKHWMVIEKSIKTEFTKRIAETHYKQALAMEYKLKTNEMENLVNQRKEEIATLKKQLAPEKKKYENAKKLLEENKSKFADVENQMKQQQNPRTSSH